MVDKQQKSIYHKSIEKRSSAGNLTGIFVVDVSPWSMTVKETGKLLAGHTMLISVQKLGQNPKLSRINIDPANKELKEALLEAYEAFENI